MDKILAITGATGKSGGAFIDILKQNNEQIVNYFGGGTPSCSAYIEY